MVARGDLGVELPLEEVPLVQKEAIEIARRNAKPVIVATQVLESMIENPRPTRAEASDAANAVLDGADALMLSGETSVGAYPVEAVETMARIIASIEEHALDRIRPLGTKPSTVGGAVAAAAAEIGSVLGAKYLITFTQSGDTAKRLSRMRNRLPMLAFTPEPAVRSQLALSWGIETYLAPPPRHTDHYAHQVDQTLLRQWRAQGGRPRGHRRRLAPRHTRAPPTPCACTAWAMRSTRWRRPTRTSKTRADPSRPRRDGPVRGVRVPGRPAGMLTAAPLPTGTPSAEAEVVEWQTRSTQNALLARACGFKSRLRHR